MDYTTLTLTDVRRELEGASRDARTTFGALDHRQLNWRPDAGQWSVAQCFEHMATVNNLVLRRVDEAINPSIAPSVWQRLPVLPMVIGRMLIRSQAPTAQRKFKAPPAALPSASDIDAGIVGRFADQVHAAAQRTQAFDERAIAHMIMTSPFFAPVVYSVLDGWRLVVAHSHRHLEQARRVTRQSGFPR